MSTTEFLKSFYSKEELHDALTPFIQDQGNRKDLLHPLMSMVGYDPYFNKQINELFLLNQRTAEEALAQGDYLNYILAHQRYYRSQAFKNICDQLSDEAYWQMLRSTRYDYDDKWYDRPVWYGLLSADRNNRHFFMNEDERKAFDKLPDECNVYRNYPESSWDFMYTLSKETVIRSYDMSGRIIGRIEKRRVKKEDVFAYINVIGRDEVIVWDFKNRDNEINNTSI